MTNKALCQFANQHSEKTAARTNPVVLQRPTKKCENTKPIYYADSGMVPHYTGHVPGTATVKYVSLIFCYLIFSKTTWFKKLNPFCPTPNIKKTLGLNFFQYTSQYLKILWMPQRGVHNISWGTTKYCGKWMDTNGSFWKRMGHLKFSVNCWNYKGDVFRTLWSIH